MLLQSDHFVDLTVRLVSLTEFPAFDLTSANAPSNFRILYDSECVNQLLLRFSYFINLTVCLLALSQFPAYCRDSFEDTFHEMNKFPNKATINVGKSYDVEGTIHYSLNCSCVLIILSIHRSACSL